MRKKTPPVPPAPRKPARPAVDPMARAVVASLHAGYGPDQASTFEMNESIGTPRGYIATRNIAMDRGIGMAGIPMGRITEISGWEGSGKSTALDQLIAECQAQGGLAVLADTERSRDRNYMHQLGVQDDTLVMIAGRTIETIFNQIEVVVRQVSGLNAVAWVDTLRRHGVRVPDCATYRHDVFDKKGDKKPAASYTFSLWGRQQSAALLEYQLANDLPPSGSRCLHTRAAVRPVSLVGPTDADNDEAYEAWMGGEQHPYAIMGDRPLLIGWDSVAATPSDKELAGDARDEHVAIAAKAIKRSFRRLLGSLADEAVAFVMVNQRYEEINTTYRPGRPQARRSQTYGGSAMKFQPSLRLELEKVGSFWRNAASKDGGDPPLGQITRSKVVKSRVGTPMRSDEYGLVYGRGADNAWAIYHDLRDRGIIRAGNWSKFTDSSLGEKSWQGTWMGLSDMMAADPALFPKLQHIYHEGR